MRKLKLALILSAVIIVITAIFSCSYASAASKSKIYTKPGIKTVIEGKSFTYKEVPIIYKGNVMLPLRSIAVNLGVKNDSKHIIWNGKKQTSTIINGKTKVVITVGSTTAKVNNKSVKLSVAPLFYKSKTYIPVRFIGNAFDKKVIWIGSKSTVVIRDEAKFNQVKQALIKTFAASGQVKKSKGNIDLTLSANIEGMTLNAKFNSDITSDGENKTGYIKGSFSMDGMDGLLQVPETEIEAYTDENALYFKNNSENIWNKLDMTVAGQEALPTELPNLDQEQLNAALGMMIASSESDELLAGLYIQKTSNSNEVLIKGSLYLVDFIQKLGLDDTSTEGLSDVKFDKLNFELSINKATNFMNKMVLDMSISPAQAASKDKINMKLTMVFSDYNGTFEVVIPEDIKNNAVPIEDISGIFGNLPIQ